MLRIDRREDDAETVRVTFGLPVAEAPGPVSVVGDFNGWDPFAHPMMKQPDGTRSVTIDFRVPTTVMFKYLAAGGLWFDEPEADRHTTGAEGGRISVLDLGNEAQEERRTTLGERSAGSRVVKPPERPPRVVVESVRPSVDGGAFPAKATVGEHVPVTADVFADGHDVVAATLCVRVDGGAWREQPMAPIGNDRFLAWLVPDREGPWQISVSGWVDVYETWRRATVRKQDAGQDIAVDLRIGADLLGTCLSGPGERRGSAEQHARLRRAAEALGDGRSEQWLEDAELTALARRLVPRPDSARSRPLEITVDRPRARFSAWYELFPRSTVTAGEDEGGTAAEGRHGTLADVVHRLDRIAAMGFDVLYLPPVHPIGVTKRKGPDNDPAGGPGAVGSPWAIGAAAGGHTAVHPDLGTVEDVRRLASACRERGIDLALDLAYQCSPDHPWVREHPEWFRHRPDGSIQYAENPPKRYEDIVPIDFGTEAWAELWEALADVVRFWAEQGVRVFRVDNPHTKPFAFWHWMIAAIKAEYPDVLFLSEAFTRPRVMERLAKVGFTQSYTYFAWYDSAAELQAYFRDLAERTVDWFRPNAWPNTPDILTEFLQEHGRPAFVLRAVLAATLAANWGVYGPAFELVEHQAVRPGSEEYLHSEKYEVRHWDLDQPHSLEPLLTRLNQIRRAHPALQQDRTLFFHETDDPQVLCYSKRDPNGSDLVVVVVNLDPRQRHATWVHLNTDALGLGVDEGYDVVDELGGGRYRWQGGRNYVDLDPNGLAAHVLVVERDALAGSA